MTGEEQEELWQVRMRELSGAIAVAALFQVFIGYSGELMLYIFKCKESIIFTITFFFI